MRIDEMPAGRECDALVAEKVMGYTLSELSLPAYPKYKLFDIESGEFSGYVKEVPHYSTDIAAAWKVWDYLKNKYHELILSWCDDMYYLLACDAHGEYLFSSEAETVPLAISRIALKAMGVTEI